MLKVVSSRSQDFAGVTSLPSSGGYAWIRGRGLFGWGERVRIDAGTGPERFERAAAAVKRYFAEDPRAIAFASFTFDDRSDDCSVVVPERLVAIDRPLPISDQRVDEDRIRYAGSSTSELEWLEAVDVAVRRIDRGVLDKVVLARDVNVWSKSPLDGRVLVARLARRFPECYAFIHGDLVGATPELLVRRAGTTIESQVLAGTIGRGADRQADDALGAELLASAKDAGEHRLAVESVTEVFGPICSEYEVEPRPRLLRLENVQHLATWVRGTLNRPLSALEVAGLLHPTAAVCGTPAQVAMDAIRELEGMERGRYGGPIGWVDAAGDGEFGIALRCAEVRGKRARLFAGSGIVTGSLPEEELEETRLKLRAMQSALEDRWAT
jgi:menaquinone-specific isochorismate synthase